MATVKLITLIFALNSISVLSLVRPSKHNLHESVWCPAECVQLKADPCQPNPCLYGGRCVLTGDQRSYRCTKCPYPTGGKNCAGLTCGHDCFRVGDKVYFIYPNPDKGFRSSQSKCNEGGMTMAILNVPSVRERVRRFLAGHNVDHFDRNYCYWIGLTQQSSADPWKWIDGTDLGPYKVSFAGTLSEQNCGDICSHRWYYNISADYCSTGHSNWKYFSLCEKKLPITLS